METNKKAIELADFIENNPNLKFDIDNDVWYCVDQTGDKEHFDSGQFSYSTDWYGHSSNYGFGVAEALVVLLNRRGFNLIVSAV